MKNNIKNLQLKNFIHIERGLIPKDTCRFVIDSIKNKSWSSHLWSTDGTDNLVTQQKNLMF
jgi:hypothetical protein